MNVLKKIFIPRHSFLGKGFKFWINIAVAVSGFYLTWKLYLIGVSYFFIFIALVLGYIQGLNHCSSCTNFIFTWKVLKAMIIPVGYGMPSYLAYFTRLSLFSYFLKKPLVKGEGSFLW